MNPEADLALMTQRRIARRKERVARWDKEADGIESTWVGGPAYRAFCRDMAGAARETTAELERELQQLGHGS
jgi:hypothetical protein